MPAYGQWIGDALVAEIGSSTIKAMLVTDAYVPDPDESSAPSAGEITGTGYTAGGIDVTSLVSVAYDSANDVVALTLSGPVDFGAIAATGIGGVALYIDGGLPLVVDMFGSVDADTGTNFVYTPVVDGVMVIEL